MVKSLSKALKVLKLFGEEQSEWPAQRHDRGHGISQELDSAAGQDS